MYKDNICVLFMHIYNCMYTRCKNKIQGETMQLLCTKIKKNTLLCILLLFIYCLKPQSETFK